MADPVGIVMAVGACARLAQVTYKKCRDCTGEYQNLVNEARALKQTLEDLEDLIREHQLTEHTEEECWERARDCKDVLEDLEVAVDKYQSLGESGRRTTNWDSETTQDLKYRLQTCGALLSTFYNNLINSEQVRIEKALFIIMEEMGTGKRTKGAVLRLSSGESGVDDSKAWPDLLRDLEDVGLDRETAEKNRYFIVDWFLRFRSSLFDSYETLPPHPGSPVLTESTGTQRTSGSYAADSANSPVTPPEPRLLEPYGQEGIDMSEDVRQKKNTFKEDISRAREYWKRKNWFEVKKNLLRVLIAAQSPKHRWSDINARTAAFLSGAAHSYSGDIEMAKKIMFSVIHPVVAGENAVTFQDLPPSDRGQIAAATWLGDLCMKTNRIESAAFAWAIALDAAIRRSQSREGTSSPSIANRISGGSYNETLTSSPPPPPRLRPVRSSGSDRSTSDHHELQIRVIIRRLSACHQKTNNLNSLLDSLEANWGLDNEESIFSSAKLMSDEQMTRVSKLALNAVDRPDLYSEALSSFSRSKSGSSTSQPQSPALSETFSHSSFSTSLIPAEDFLMSPVRQTVNSTAWPLEWDPEFNCQSALTTIDWFFSFTPLSGEGTLHNLEPNDSKTLKEHSSATIASNVDAKTSDKFLITLKRLLRSLGFQYKEQPGSLRCLNKTNGWSRYASIACLELCVIKYRPDGILRSVKMAAYISNILHWDNYMEKSVVERDDTKSLVSEMAGKIKIYDAEAKGLLLPSSGPDVAAQGV